MRRLLATLATILTCTCCAPAVYLYQAKPLNPEGWYRRLYEQAAACVGSAAHKDADYGKIKWFITPKGNMGDAAGIWSWPDRIYLDEGFASNPYVVRHEELHYLLGGGEPGSDPHEAADFVHCVDAPFPF